MMLAYLGIFFYNFKNRVCECGVRGTKKLSLKREMLKKNTLNYLNNEAEPISPV